MKNQLLSAAFLAAFTVGSVYGQTLQLNRTGGTVSIGSDGTAVSASAVLDVKSTTQGVLLPRLTTAQRTAIANPANGLLVFDSTTQSFWFRQNGVWVSLSGSGGSTGWQQTGNDIVNSNSGNVGIGVPVPYVKLDLLGNTRFSGNNQFYGNSQFSGTPLSYTASVGYSGGVVRVFDRASSSLLHLDGNQTQALNSIYSNDVALPTGPAVYKLNPLGGNVGIGMGSANPQAQLHIKAANAYALRLDGVEALQTFNHTDGKEYAYLRAWTTNPGNSAGYYGLELGVPPADANGPAKHLMFATNYALRMVILDNGNIGIGTTNPTHKLAVNGTIRAKELVVETGWADFVFAKNYRLRPLREVERFIQTHHHLPGIAPASEIEQRGVAIADATTKLMQKVEELTLYAIRQDKELRRLKKQLNIVSRGCATSKLN